MKDKNLAGVLALFFGWLGIHRFYLGQVGWGIFYLFFFWFSWMISLVDAIAFFAMDKDEFDRRYNRDALQYRPYSEDFRRGRYREDYRSRTDERRREIRERVAERKKEERERQQYRQGQNQKRTAANRRPTRRSNRPKSHNPFRESGIQKFKDFDYDEAIIDFNKALEINPSDVATHFNLACAYSVTENKDKAFFHLDRAVALGFDDWKRIKSHDSLAYIRIQDEFEQFEANGFRLAAQLEVPEDELLDSTPTKPKEAEKKDPLATDDLLEQLRRLGELREKGLLTEAEFASQKKKLLG